MNRIASSPQSLEHQTDVRTEDVHEPCGWVTYRRAVCSCGFRGERWYVAGMAYGELADHLESVVPAPESTQRPVRADGGRAEKAGTPYCGTSRERIGA